VTIWTGTAASITAGTTTLSVPFNTNRDAIKAASEAWTSYTPTWTASAGTPSVGDGTLTGKYARVNKLIDFRIELVFGSTTTMGTAGSVQRFALPVTPVSTQRHRFLGTAYDSGTADYTAYFRWNSAGYLEVVCQPTTAGNGDRTVSNTVPFTWGTGDVLMVQGRYECA
jgi:hypothetical protein